MNISYNWVKETLKTDISVSELTDELTLAGLEVEQIKQLANASNLVIGHVIGVEKHPDADTLNIAKVDIKDEILQIVCGGPNLALDQKVIVAKVGADVNGLEIKAAEIRGVASTGMICSYTELGVDEKTLSDDDKMGIAVLDDNAPIGHTDVLNYLGLDDTIIEVDLTPNRSDVLAMNSLAYELAAILDKKVEINISLELTQGLDTRLKVASKSEKSANILGKVINKVSIKPSVDWMKKQLVLHGFSPINNVVDISNIVMIETGQPLHFYDLDKLPTLELIVEDQHEEEYTALNDEVYDLLPEDLVITSNNQVIGIAGVMGGANTKISDDTTGLVIEAAQFDQTQIRKTAQRLNIDSEAAIRYTKGIDPQAIYKAMNRAVELLETYADATDIETTVAHSTHVASDKKITTSQAYISQRLGVDLDVEEIVDFLERLNFKTTVSNDEINVIVPTYRMDVNEEVDLSEEILRMYGVDKLEATLPLVQMKPTLKSQIAKDKKVVTNLLLNKGYSEVITYSLVSKRHINDGVMNIGEPVVLSNPLSAEREYYRTSLLPSLIDTIKYNEAHSNYDYKLYEYGKVYDHQNNEELRLGLVSAIESLNSTWEKRDHAHNFYTIKGLVISVLNKLGINEQRVSFENINEDLHLLHPYLSANVLVDRKQVGIIGQLHPTYAKNSGVKTALVAEINMTAISSAKKARISFTPLPKYPGTSRDISLIVDSELTVEQMIKTILKAGKPLVTDAYVFDVYQGDNIDALRKSIAIRIHFQSNEKTLTDKDVNVIYDKIKTTLEDQYQVESRK